MDDDWGYARFYGTFPISIMASTHPPPLEPRRTTLKRGCVERFITRCQELRKLSLVQRWARSPRLATGVYLENPEKNRGVQGKITRGSLMNLSMIKLGMF